LQVSRVRAEDAQVDTPKTRYARSADGTYIAFQVFGSGPDVLVAWPWISHLELFWEDPDVGAWLRSLARFARVITLDQRGLGLSDRMTQTVDLETKMDDVRAVLDAAGSERPVLYGQGVDGGAICAMFAATHPDRTAGLLFWRGDPSGRFGQTDEEIDAFDRMLEASWGDDDVVAPFLAEMGGPTPAADPVAVRRWARLMRNAASRGDALVHSRVFNETDFEGILGSIHVPTRILQPDDEGLPSAQRMAAAIPGAEMVVVPGQPDHPPYLAGTDDNLKAVERFLTSIRDQEAELDRVLATVLFTDIVDSTATAAVMGDAKWRALIETHDSVARGTVARYQGTFVRGTGDGMLATFDGPARAVRCAHAFREAMRSHEVDVRAGVHTGEITYGGNDLAGIGVHVAARVASMAGASEVWASSTVKDLTAGSGLVFEDAGEHELKGVPDTWRLYRVTG
jgi:class 3 adenylate cyclase/pimeloyl-ACP methyl ester carboxylesterase